MSFLTNWIVDVLIVGAILVMVLLRLLWIRVVAPWEEREAIKKRDGSYLFHTRSNFVPVSVEQIWMALPLMQEVLHVKAVFIDSLHQDRERLEAERANNAERADYLLEEHGRLTRKIQHEMERFRFAQRIFNAFAKQIGVELPEEYKQHTDPPVEFVRPPVTSGGENNIKTA